MSVDVDLERATEWKSHTENWGE